MKITGGSGTDILQGSSGPAAQTEFAVLSPHLALSNQSFFVV